MAGVRGRAGRAWRCAAVARSRSAGSGGVELRHAQPERLDSFGRAGSGVNRGTFSAARARVSLCAWRGWR